MLITHAVSDSAELGKIYWLKSVVERLSGEHNFEILVPEGSAAESLLGGVRAKLTALPLCDDEGNMLKNVRILTKHFKRSGSRIVHSHGSVSATVASFLVSRGDVVSIKDYYTTLMLRRVFGLLSPRARLSLTASLSPSDTAFYRDRGIRRGSIIDAPYGVSIDSGAKRLSHSGTPIISAWCKDGEECAFFLSAVAILLKKYTLLAYIEAPEKVCRLADGLARALGIGHSVVSFSVGSMPKEIREATFAFVYPSLYVYSIPIESAHFMSLGVPAVVPSTPRCRDLVRHGESGLIYRFGDSCSLIGAVANLLSNSEKTDTLGDLGRERVENLFSIDSSCAALSEIYKSLAKA